MEYETYGESERGEVFSTGEYQSDVDDETKAEIFMQRMVPIDRQRKQVL